MLPCTRKRMGRGEIGPAGDRDPRGLDARCVATRHNRGLIRSCDQREVFLKCLPGVPG